MNTEQLWAGQFGDTYHERNGQNCRHRLWSHVLNSMMRKGHHPVDAIDHTIELGAGQGDNLVALRNLFGIDKRYVGVDINEGAVQSMEQRGLGTVQSSLRDLVCQPYELNSFDLVLTRGCLIHIPEHQLQGIFGWMARVSSKYVCIAEYYSPQRRVVSDYHGEVEALWADDFAGKFLVRNQNWRLVDYGFMYRGDGGDDETWFLLEKVYS